MTEETTPPLKLLALDGEDLKVLSAHLQDAVLKLGDMIYLPSEQRFAAILNRFDWITAETEAGSDPRYRRCRTALRFDKVTQAQLHNIDPSAEAQVAELLAVTYDEVDPPGGTVTLFFAGGGAVRLHVECVEAELRDLSQSWQARSKPEHGEVSVPSLDRRPISPHASDGNSEIKGH